MTSTRTLKDLIVTLLKESPDKDTGALTPTDRAQHEILRIKAGLILGWDNRLLLSHL